MKRQTRTLKLLSRPKQADYKTLREEWYQKLKDDGFDDAEKGDLLKRWDSHYFQSRYTEQVFEIKREYYCMCELFLNSYGFDSRLDLEVWRLHTDGLAPEKIAPCIKAMGIKTSWQNIYNIINRLEKIMKTGLFFE